MYQFTHKELLGLLSEAAEAGANKALIESGALKPFISKNQADKSYGRRNVDRWIREGLVIAIKDGTNSSSVRIDRVKIDLVSKSSNRASWYNNLKGEK